MAGNRRTLGWLIATLVGISLIAGLIAFPGGFAQGAHWSCPEPATASTSAGATPAASAGADVAFPAGGGELTVFAAASLTDALTAIAADLEAANPNLAIAYNFAGSQTLVTQLTAGAAADLFASANPEQMAAAMEAGVIAAAAATFATNRLVIAVPSDNPAGLATAADLATEGMRLVIAQPEVPAGAYARQAICQMNDDTAIYGDDFVARVAANIVSVEDDVRDVLTKVVLGEADAGIVYVSDAVAAGDEVRLIEIPDPVNVVAAYPIAPVTGGDPALGAAFIAYLLSPEGQETLARYGFGPVP